MIKTDHRSCGQDPKARGAGSEGSRDAGQPAMEENVHGVESKGLDERLDVSGGEAGERASQFRAADTK